MKHLTSKILIAVFFIMQMQLANAEVFQRTGKITRVLTDAASYGGCMVLLNVSIGNNCPTSGWVSLDCKSTTGDGNRHFASALLAASLGKQVTLYIDNAVKRNTYCVANRLDVLYP